MKEFDYKKFMEMKNAEMKRREEKVERYFYKKKERQAYYHAVGESWDEEQGHMEVFIHFSDEDVERIKELMVEAANLDEGCEPVSLWQEAEKELSYSELCERNEELQRLLGDRLEGTNICADSINFDERIYFYTFSIVGYDYKEKKVTGPVEREIMLSDEQYLTLLKMQVNDRKGFTFNTLMKRNPELAAELNRQITCYEPYTILFDEVRRDAEIVDGPMDANGVLYESEDDEDRLYHVIADAQHGKLEIIEEELKDGDFANEHRLYVTDAVRVMKAMGSITYDEMLVKMKDRFGSESCFADIRQWLESKGIKYIV